MADNDIYSLSPDNDPNLKNMYHALQYSPDGFPELRVASRISAASLGNLNVNIVVSPTVSVSNFPANQQIYGHVTIDELTEVEIKNDVGNPIRVTGNVNAAVTNTVSVNQTSSPWIIQGNTNSIVSGTVTSNQGTTPWNVIGNTNSIVSGTVTTNQGTNPWVIIGNVNAAITSATEIEIKNDLGNPIPIVGNIAIPGTTNVSIGGTNTDAFGRIRVSNPLTLFDNNFRYGDKPDIWDTALAGTGAATFNSNTKVVGLGVLQNGDSVIRETKYCYTYQPGKSLLIMNTFCMSEPVTGLRQRVGYFGARNGVFLETDGATISFVIRKDITGSISDAERSAQSSWNGDRLNSTTQTQTCPSGIKLDLSKPQILWIDVEWLGVGAVRCGFVINGQFILCHTFYHANTGSITGPYMATASLPIRYEITATGSVAATLNQICSTVISEGGYEPQTRIQSIGMGVSTKGLGTSGTYHPLISLRLNSAYPDAIIRLHQLQGMISTASAAPKNIHFKILKNATLTGASWVQHSSQHVDYDLSATIVTGGDQINEGYFNASRAIEFTDGTNPAYQIGRNIAGVSDVFTLVATGDSNNLDVAMEMGWYDFS